MIALWLVRNPSSFNRDAPCGSRERRSCAREGPVQVIILYIRLPQILDWLIELRSKRDLIILIFIGISLRRYKPRYMRNPIPKTLPLLCNIESPLLLYQHHYAHNNTLYQHHDTTKYHCHSHGSTADADQRRCARNVRLDRRTSRCNRRDGATCTRHTTGRSSTSWCNLSRRGRLDCCGWGSAGRSGLSSRWRRLHQVDRAACRCETDVRDGCGDCGD